MSNTKGKRRYKTKKKQTATRIDMMVAGLIVLSILLGALIYTKSGFVGNKLSEIFGGMFGVIEYILPIGIKIACEKQDTIASKLTLYLVLLISMSVVFSVFQLSFDELDRTKELSEVAKDAYEIGMLSKGGGALGAIVAVPLVNLLGTVGAIILCIGSAVLLVIFTFGINTSDIISSNVDKMKERREERLQERQRYRMEMAQRAEEAEQIREKQMKKPKIKAEVKQENNKNRINTLSF